MDGKEALSTLIRYVMRETAYHRISLATVAAPSDGSTVDLMPDDPDIAASGVQGVPVLYGIPGVKAKFLPGAKMLLFFLSGDPKQPRAMCFDGSAAEITMGGGVMGVARVGDQVTLTAATSPAGTVTGVGIITGGSIVVKA
jgi:hypothetical protein